MVRGGEPSGCSPLVMPDTVLERSRTVVGNAVTSLM